jgi:uncharacterized membrane protein YcfT
MTNKKTRDNSIKQKKEGWTNDVKGVCVCVCVYCWKNMSLKGLKKQNQSKLGKIS